MLNYFHYNKQRSKNLGQPYTICLNLDFSKDLLYNALRLNIPVVIETGIAKLHPDDKFFIKRIGRTMAKLEGKILTYNIKGVNCETNKNTFFLLNDEYNVIIILSVDKDRTNPMLIYSSYNEVKYER